MLSLPSCCHLVSDDWLAVIHNHGDARLHSMNLMGWIRGGSRAGGLGGALQLTWRQTRCTNPFLTRMHARARAHTRMHNFDQHAALSLTCILDSLIKRQCYPNSIIRNVHWFHSGHNQCAALLYIREKRGFISLSRSVMNEIVNVLWKYCCGVAAGVFARFSCRHSWNLRLCLTEPGNYSPANTVHVLRPNMSMLSWHSSIATSVMAVRMSMQRSCKLILSDRT